MTLPELCIRRPVMTTLLMVLIIVIGLFGYRLLPVAALPNVDFPTISVSATLPGASPETMAASVATPLERQFATIPGVRSITSTSNLGNTQITLQFDLNRNIDGAALDVQSAISEAQRSLPDEMTEPPGFRKHNPADQPVIFVVMRSDSLPLSQIDEYAETLVTQRIATLPGVAQVQVFGSQKYAVRVQVDPHALAAAGISFSDIQQALAAANSNAPLGQLKGNERNLTIQATAQLSRAAEFLNLIVAYRNGKPITLGNIAKVIDSVEDDQRANWSNGTRSIALPVFRQPDANAVEIADAVRAMVPELRKQIPESITMAAVSDRSQSIRASLHEVEFTLMLTVVLVVLVIFLFLRSATATIIPALALPISIIGTFAAMYIFKFSLNNLSLLALTLSVGFVVDDAIVMLENIVRHIEKGEKPLEAALKGSREIAFTIVSITLSLVAVFIPVLFMGGVVGRLFGEFAVTISVTILLSGFVALTLTPMLASRVLKPIDVAKHPASKILRAFEEGFDKSRAFYERTLNSVLRHQHVMLYVTLATIGASGLLFIVVPKGFIPSEDMGFLRVSTEAVQDISFSDMARLQQEAAAVVLADPAVAVVNSAIGAGGGGGSLHTGRMFVNLKPFNQRRASADEIIARLKPKLDRIPGIKSTLRAEQTINVGGRQTKGQYQFVIQGTDLDEVQDASPVVVDALQKISGLLDVDSDLRITNPQVYVDIDRERAGALNVTAEAIRTTLYSAFGSRQVATIYTPSNDYPVILEVAPSFRNDADALGSIYVPATTGRLVPLEAVATITRNVGPLSVAHESALPAVVISFNLEKGMALGDAVNKVEAAVRALGLPPSLTTRFQGTAQVFQDSLVGQGLLLIAAIFVIYVVLGILYESFIHPITILSGLPAAGLGALLTLMMVGMDLSVIAIIGIVMLIGIVKKNAIMMIDFALERQREAGIPADEAIYQACLIRFRPIMMTTMAALMGSLPIALGTGAGSELRQPLGVAVVGGLLVSQLLTLYITPVIYLYLDRTRAHLAETTWRDARRGLWARMSRLWLGVRRPG